MYLANRRHHTFVYIDEMADLPIRPLGFSDIESCAPWRFTFSVDSNLRDELLEWLWHNNCDASFWYPSLEGWFYEHDRFHGCPVAANLARSVINLWVDKPEKKYSYKVAWHIRDFFENKKIICNKDD